MAKNRKDSRGRVLHTGEYEEIKASGSYYVYKYQDVTGKRSRVSAKTLPELREKEKALNADMFDGLKTGRERDKTVADMTRIYLDTKINLKGTTASNYEYMAQKFIIESPLGKQKVKTVTKSDIQKYYGDLLRNGMKSSTLENIHTILHPVFQRAIDDGYIRINPTQGVMTEIKKSELWVKTKRPALTIEEQAAFIDYVKASPIYDHWGVLFTFLLGTGCRIGEAIGLCWEDVDFKENVIRVQHNLVYRWIYSADDVQDGDSKVKWIMSTPKTEDGKREIPMLSEVRSVLLAIKEEQTHSGNVWRIPAPVEINGEKYNLVFRNRDGGALLPSCINRAIKRIVRDYNRDKTADMVTLPEFSVHQLRHTFCTRLCENSSNVKAIQEIMGHADITTTMNVYADATRQAKKNTLEAMEGKVKIS